MPHPEHLSSTPSPSRPQPVAHTVAELAAHVGGTVSGDADVVIRGLAALVDAREGDIAYVDEPKRFEAAAASLASCVIVPEHAEVLRHCRIAVKNPKFAFVRIAELLLPAEPVIAGIHATAVIDTGARVDASAAIGAHVSIGAGTAVGAGTRIAPGVVIGRDVTIGAGCVIHPNVVVYDGVRIGHRVIIHAGGCVGADGFGYVADRGGLRKFPQSGSVIIEDDVELGAGVCVDRGALGATRVGRGSKIDNLVHVGHNVDIGEHVVIAAQTGISGSVVIEDEVMISGQVGFGEHVRIRRGAMIGARSSVLPGKIVRQGQWCGTPVLPLRQYKRLNAHARKLPRMRAEIADLRRRLREIEASVPVSSVPPKT